MKAFLPIQAAAICCMLLLSLRIARGETRASADAPEAAPSVRMKAVVHHDYGSPEVLHVEDIDKPVPAGDEILVKVRAVSLNPLDWHFMRGEPYFMRAAEGALFAPKRIGLGADVAGEVEAVGPNVTAWKPGDAVFGCRFGSLAEYVVGPSDSFVAKPPNVSFEEAAAVPVAGVTALQGLRDQGKIAAGQKVLINGASGGVGTYAVQIAKSFGAEVTGVCSGRNAALVRSLGADHVVDYTQEDFTKSGKQYDLILDMVGSQSFFAYRRALTPRGTLVIVGNTDKGRWLGPLTQMLRGLVFSRFVSQNIVTLFTDETAQDLEVLGRLLQTGKMKSVIDGE